MMQIKQINHLMVCNDELLKYGENSALEIKLPQEELNNVTPLLNY